ncbi:hypothetical protein MKX03_033966 [Papaver bracteatum]|nr:hypothetical protein MKX03_033966 [Papaver bracteatum]
MKSCSKQENTDDGSFISIQMPEQIANSIKKKIEISAPHSRTSEACCIYRVPEKYHKMCSAYRPEGISIGPYHRPNQTAIDMKLQTLEATEDLKHPGFKTTQDLKLLYAHKVLILTTEQKIEEEEPKPTRTIKLDSMGTLVTSKGWLSVLEVCVSSIEKMETDIRQCYSEPVDLDSKEFVEMMVIDGLFIVGLLLVRFPLEKEKIVDDLLQNNHWLSIAVDNDILLLENQLPFFVLQSLFDIISQAAGPEVTKGSSLQMLVVEFFNSNYLYMLPNTILETHLKQCAQAKHLLDFLFILLKPTNSEEPITGHSSVSSKSLWDIIQILKKFIGSVIAKFTINVCSLLKLFRKTLVKLRIMKSSSGNEENETLLDSVAEFIPSATELSRAGIKFKRGSTKTSFLEIKFNDGVMEIPPISIYDGTDTLLRNLIACEQLYNGYAHFSSYALLMDSLIDSSEDVEALRKERIITNYLGCDQDVCNIFNNLGFEVSVADDHYSLQSKAANTYYKNSWHKWRATLWREYFNNPWSIISFSAAFLLIALTVVSTIFTILSFVVPKA